MSLVELARFNTRVEADAARLTFESHQIDAVLFDAAEILKEGGLLPPG